MKTTAQVIDYFESRGKLVLTLWELVDARRLTIRVPLEARVTLGEIVALGDEWPQLCRVPSDDLKSDLLDSAILPISGQDNPEDRVIVGTFIEEVGHEQVYGTSVA
jgi:hypothetical protein